MADRQLLFKAIDGPRRYSLGAVYVPAEIDGHGEAMLPSEIESMAWRFQADHGQIGVALGPAGNALHVKDNDAATGHCTVVESYIWRGPDWDITDTTGRAQTITAGTWMLAGIWDQPGWDLVERKIITGWSMLGTAPRRPPTASEKAALTKSAVALRRR